MSKLLNRGNVFVVVRTVYQNRFDTDEAHFHAVAAFSELDEADEYKGACEQKWKEKVGHLEDVDFDIQMTTYYGK